MTLFEPTTPAAARAVANINPAIYAKTRNDLSGAVTRLSPYITHGFVNIPDIVASLHAKTPLRFEDKIVFEFAWREFFHHVWAHKGDAIFKGIYESVYSGTYAKTLPDDIAQGRTGVPCIDAAVRELYATGYLHNHARMWLASYVVHIRKVHWRAGADWLYAHLLDGDCASNHLSWQWVAGTFSSKPYLFNAENVARFTSMSSHAHWRSEGTVIDQSYEALDDWARSKQQAGAEPGHHDGVVVPPVIGVPSDCATTPDLAGNLAGKALRLVHPWDLMDVDDEEGDTQSVNVAWLCPAFHSAMPWSQPRWAWVLTRLKSMSALMVVGDSNALKPLLDRAASVTVQLTKNASYATSIAALSGSLPRCITTLEPMLLPPVDRLCNSFTKFYQTAQKQAGRLESCL